MQDAEVAGCPEVHLDVARLDGTALEPAGAAVDLAAGDGCPDHEAARLGGRGRHLADEVVALAELGRMRIDVHGRQQVRVETSSKDVVGAGEGGCRMVHRGPAGEPARSRKPSMVRSRRIGAKALRALSALPEEVDEGRMVLEAIGGDAEDALRADVRGGARRPARWRGGP